MQILLSYLTLFDKWFNDLKHGNINYFVKLIRLFMTYYASNKPLKKWPHHLFSTIQNADESIEVFVKRFYEEKIELYDCSNSISV